MLAKTLMLCGALACAACTTRPPDAADDAPDAALAPPRIDAPRSPDAPGCADTIEEVTTAPVDAPPSPALALARGEPQIVYAIDGHTLRLATRARGAWSTAPIDVTPASEPAAVVGGDGVLHACVTAAENGHLGPIVCFDRTPGGETRTATIDPGPRAHPSLAIDAQGGLHLAYLAADGLWYAHRAANGAWTAPERIADRTPLEASIAVDGRRTPYVAYASLDGGARALHVAIRGASGWTDTPVAAEAPVLAARALAVDRGGWLHLIYLDGGRVPTYLERDPAGVWSRPRVIDPEVDARAPAIALGPDAVAVAVAHVAIASGQIRLAQRDAAGAWSVLPVHDDTAWTEVGLALDASGAIHVAFVAAAGPGSIRLLHATVCAAP
jgi:hypothetical protein